MARRRAARAGGGRIAGSWLAAVTILLCATQVRALTDDQLLDSLQHTAFDYFWNEANPTNGLIRDRSTPTSPASIAAMGFGLSAICIGADHGWVTRDAARARVLTTLQTLWNQPQGTGTTGFIGYQGLYYHFLDMTTATRTWDCELSTIDTALLFAGIIDARQYFTTADPLDVQVRALADTITHRANWNAFRNFGPGLYMGWKPLGGFNGFGIWVGYNEAMIMYILALGSPTHPVPNSSPDCWATWTSGYDWNTFYGYSYVVFPPLFGHQYSHCWVDFRHIWDTYMQGRGITYFENSRRATMAQRAYCVENPGHYTGYGPNLWGLTASDDPLVGYNARGAPPAQNDNGTITPTAPASSVAFAPGVVLPCLQNMYNTYGAQLWGTYGFKDAFNPTLGWYDSDWLGIDEGPIVIMIENYRTGAVWNRFMQNPDVQRGLQRAGFVPATGVDVGPAPGLDATLALGITPNPFRGSAQISFRLPAAGRVSVTLYDASGRRVRSVFNGTQAPGPHTISVDATGLASGVYYYRLEAGGRSTTKRCILVR